MSKKIPLLRFYEAASLKEDELPAIRFLEPETLFLLPLPARIRACCEDENEDVMEEEYSILTAPDGKQSFGRFSRYRESPKNILEYDQIIKLTYGHYLSRNGLSYAYYAVCHNAVGREILQPTLRFSFQGELTLELFLKSLSAAYPDLFNQLSRNLFRASDQEGYISVYRMYSRWLIGSDITLPLAFQRVVLDNHFNIIRLYDFVDW